VGDSRVNIFLAVAGAVLAALGLSENITNLPATMQAKTVTAAALFLVLGFGWFTLIRLIHRNLVTDDYLRKLGRLRCAFVHAHPEVEVWLPFRCQMDRENRKLEWQHMIWPPKAGLVELVCFVNAMTAGGVAAILFLTALPFGWEALFILSSVAALLVWVLEFRFVRKRYHRGLDPDNATSPTHV
jgi:hypothetical protein